MKTPRIYVIRTTDLCVNSHIDFHIETALRRLFVCKRPVVVTHTGLKVVAKEFSSEKLPFMQFDFAIISKEKQNN